MIYADDIADYAITLIFFDYLLMRHAAIYAADADTLFADADAASLSMLPP